MALFVLHYLTLITITNIQKQKISRIITQLFSFGITIWKWTFIICCCFFFLFIIRFDDVSVLYKNRADNVCQIEWWNGSHKSILCNTALEIGFSCIRWIWNAWHIFQLWIITVDGEIHRKRKVSILDAKLNRFNEFYI